MITIRKATQKQAITAFYSGDFSEINRIKEIAEKEARQVFEAVSSGAVPLIWYELPQITSINYLEQ